MALEVLFFGQLADITSTSCLQMDTMSDTDALLDTLRNRFPALRAATFVLAVNGQIVHQNTQLDTGTKVALLPPFCG